jgi:hypothetical protein
MTSRKSRIIAIAFAASGAIWSADAQNARAQEPEPGSGFGMVISAGGGVEDFTDPGMRDTTGVSGVWDVRFQLGTRFPLAIEAAYLGSAQTIDAIGLDSSAVLLGSTLEAAVRLNATTDQAMQPYLYAGAAWRHYQLTDVDTNTSAVADTDDVVEIPFGAGIAYRFRGFVADARLGVRLAGDQDLLPASDGGFQTMHRWGALARIGYEL